MLVLLNGKKNSVLVIRT